MVNGLYRSSGKLQICLGALGALELWSWDRGSDQGKCPPEVEGPAPIQAAVDSYFACRIAEPEHPSASHRQIGSDGKFYRVPRWVECVRAHTSHSKGFTGCLPQAGDNRHGACCHNIHIIITLIWNFGLLSGHYFSVSDCQSLAGSCQCVHPSRGHRG